MAVKQPYVVLKQEAGFSRHLGTEYVKITFLGIKDRKEYITYVDTPNHNYKNWEHIIRNPRHGFVVRNLKTKTHKGHELVNADSRPIIEIEDTDDVEIMRQVAEIWAEEDLKANSDRFRDMFE
jgi:predicted alpha/beta hydrolase